jgi:hypothetical protein
VIQARYRERKAFGKVLVPWAVDPLDAIEFFKAMEIAVPPDPDPEDLAACLDHLIKRVTG